MVKNTIIHNCYVTVTKMTHTPSDDSFFCFTLAVCFLVTLRCDEIYKTLKMRREGGHDRRLDKDRKGGKGTGEHLRGIVE